MVGADSLGTELNGWYDKGNTSDDNTYNDNNHSWPKPLMLLPS
jgi:hypothetical protein